MAGSPFASLTRSEPIPLPFDEGQWIQTCKLTADQDAEAQKSHRGTFLDGRWAETFRRMLRNAADPAVLAVVNDPLAGYDLHALVRFGVVAWSYPQPLTPEVITPASEGVDAVVKDWVKDLGPEALDFMARTVLKRTRPNLFIETAAGAEAERKNG